MTTSNEFFQENYKLFGSDPKLNPEKYNLYNGLCALAQEIESLKSELIALKLANLELISRLSSR